MHFAQPYFLYLLLFIPLFVGGIWWRNQRSMGINIPFLNDLLKAQNDSGYINKIFFYLRNIIIIFIIILYSVVLARPQSEHSQQNISKKGIDIIVAMDVSQSMLAEDLQPNRLEAAKVALQKFIANLQDDRLGIIIFAGQAFTQSPLTFDYNILTEYIKNISTNSINKNVRGLSGTAIGDAILSADNRFKESKNRTKVLVVITDGDANMGVDPEIATKKARSDGIKIYTVGIGKKGGAFLPVTDIFGKKTYARNTDGSFIKATFNEQALKKIAKLGGGRYFRADNNQTFNEVMNEINTLEKRSIEVDKIVEYSESFWPFLLVLAILFGFYIMIIYYQEEIK